MYDLKAGDKVKYIGCSESQIKWGSHTDPRGVLKGFTTYTVKSVDIHNWHTKVYLIGFTGHFNSVCFEKV